MVYKEPFVGKQAVVGMVSHPQPPVMDACCRAGSTVLTLCVCRILAKNQGHRAARFHLHPGQGARNQLRFPALNPQVKSCTILHLPPMTNSLMEKQNPTVQSVLPLGYLVCVCARARVRMRPDPPSLSHPPFPPPSSSLPIHPLQVSDGEKACGFTWHIESLSPSPP